MLTKALIIAVLTLTLTHSQTIYCDIPQQVVPTLVSSNNGNVMVTNQLGVIVGVWNNAQIGDTATITVGSWSDNNGSLKVAIAVGDNSSISANVAGQKGVIGGMASNDEYIFAQKDDANTDFKIEVQATKNASQTTFGMALAVAGYNGNSSCEATCGSGLGVKFFKDGNGTTYINQFVCWEGKLVMGFVLIMLGLIF